MSESNSKPMIRVTREDVRLAATELRSKTPAFTLDSLTQTTAYLLAVDPASIKNAVRHHLLRLRRQGEIYTKGNASPHANGRPKALYAFSTKMVCEFCGKAETVNEPPLADWEMWICDKCEE